MVDYITQQDVFDAFPDIPAGKWTPQELTLIPELITRASRYLDTESWKEIGAYIVQSDTVQKFNGPSVYNPDNDKLWTLEMAQAPTLVEISTNGSQNSFTTLASSNYFLWPDQNAAFGKPYYRIDLNTIDGSIKAWPPFRSAIRVTARFGYSVAIRDDIKQGVVMQVARWIRRAKQRYQNISVQTDPNQSIYREYDPEFTELCHQLRQGSLGYVNGVG